MKRIFIAMVALLVVSAATAQEKKPLAYVDASTLTIINKIQSTEMPFERLDVERYSSLTPKAVEAFRQSTGLALVFSTNSRNIYVRWSVHSHKHRPNSPDIYLRGMDIYLRHDGRWTFAGVARPKTDPAVLEFESPLVRRMGEGEKECLVYLPAYAHIKSIEIGIDEGATIKPMPSPFKHKIVFIGSSLTHGEGAPRPGANYVAQLGRRLNAETPNLGHSGQCKLQQHFVDIVCDTQADAYIFDAFSNPTDQIINERLYDFVKQIRAKHKKTPLIFLQTVRRTGAMFDLVAKKRNDDQRAAAEKLMAEICRDFKNVYFIDNAFDTGADNEGTVDNSHLTDHGIYRVLQIMEPQLREILSHHGIK
ncbi:MAG: hypothetical protein E7130_01840 [Rikenellaceae bacterium]|nr:hypothetical protein [Rikenellaceae bacterium]